MTPGTFPCRNPLHFICLACGNTPPDVQLGVVKQRKIRAVVMWEHYLQIQY